MKWVWPELSRGVSDDRVVLVAADEEDSTACQQRCGQVQQSSHHTHTQNTVYGYVHPVQQHIHTTLGGRERGREGREREINER